MEEYEVVVFWRVLGKVCNMIVDNIVILVVDFFGNDIEKDGFFQMWLDLVLFAIF